MRAYRDDPPEPPIRRLTKGEAEALRARQPALSPWRVVAAQVAIGAIAGAIAWLVIGDAAVAASAVYGAAVAALPSALMALGATRRTNSAAPLAGAATLFAYMLVKLLATVLLLAVAPRVVPGLSWPALLFTLVLCLQTYWLALLWRPAARPSNPL